MSTETPRPDPESEPDAEAEVEPSDVLPGPDVELEPVEVETVGVEPEEPELEPEAVEVGGALVAEPGGFRNRWEEIQVAFVDEPRGAVEDADQLVVEVIDEITAVLTRERDEIAARWREQSDASTEDLRQAFQDYRTVFDQLLAV